MNINLNSSISYWTVHGGSFSPPQSGSAQQWLDGTEEGMGNLDGNAYLTINKPETITSEWKCFHEGLWIPKAPQTSEIMYRAIESSNYLQIFSDASNGVALNGTGAGYKATSFTLSNSVLTWVKLELKTGFAKVTVNGVSEEFAWALSFSEIDSSTVGGAEGGALEFSGKLVSFSDCTESFSVINGVWIGSLGTIPTVTDPNGVMYKYNYLQDWLSNGAYALKNNSTGEFDLNASNTQTWTGAPAQGAELTKVEIAALDNGSTVFSSPSTTNVMRFIPYDDGTSLSAGEIASINNYTGR